MSQEPVSPSLLFSLLIILYNLTSNVAIRQLPRLIVRKHGAGAFWSGFCQIFGSSRPTVFPAPISVTGAFIQKRYVTKQMENASCSHISLRFSIEIQKSKYFEKLLG